MNYTLALRPPSPASTQGSYSVDIGTIGKGCYRATFRMTGLDRPGYLAVNWSGITNHVDTNSDSRAIACCFTDYDSDIYTGVLYLTDPGSQINISFWSTADTLLSTQVKPIVTVQLERLAPLVQHSDCMCKPM
jgi:hypothetical protein